MTAVESTPRRLYALTKIAPGDYIFPSNDKTKFWRIAKYEDGPSHGIDREDMPRDRDFWGVWKWEYAPSQVELHGDELLGWDCWHMEASGCDTRAEAIKEAIRLG